MTTVHKAAEISLTTKSISDVTGGMLNVQMMEQLGRNGITSLLIPLKVASEINACDHQ
jgi:isopentenyl phosphate kinase